MPTVLITGSSRGLGLEWVRQYAQAGWRVIATCRRPEQAGDLQRIAAEYDSVTVHCLDVTRDGQIRDVLGETAGRPVDVLLNNAGVFFEKFDADRMGDIDYRDWEETFRVNVLGPVRMTEAFVERVADSERRLVVVITSHMGSITDIDTAGSYAYRSSKAALNAAMRGMSFELAGRGVGLLMMHPGWVKTRMGGTGAQLTTTESVERMRAMVERFDPGMSGRFFRYDGVELPW